MGDRGGCGYDRRGVGGLGGYRGRGVYTNDRGRSDLSRGVRGGGPLLRGSRSRGAHKSVMEREQEKQEGKKNAIAETIAMMNKMKMEDKEREVLNARFDEERRERHRELGLEPPVPLEVPPPPVAPLPLEDHSSIIIEDQHNRGRRGGRDPQPRFQRGLQGGRGRGGMRGGRGGLNSSVMPPIFGGQPNPAMAAPGMLFPPPGMPGFPGKA